MIKEEKTRFYSKVIKDLNESNPSQWYSKLKRLCSYDLEKQEELHCEEIDLLSDQEQADELAEFFSDVRNQFDELRSCDIQAPVFVNSMIPQVSHLDGKKELENIKANKSVPPGDIPPKVLKIFSEKLSKPITHIYNSSLRQGVWPSMWKKE